MRRDLELNGLADSPRSQDVESAAPDELKDVIISRRVKCLKGDLKSVGQSEGQELELYLRHVAQVGGNLAEAAR